MEPGRTAPRTVNMVELAQLAGMSANTLRHLIRLHPDFPVQNRGAKGSPYAFDVDSCAAWWHAHAAEIEQAERARREQVDQWRLELFGETPAPEQCGRRLTPAERKAVLEAQVLEEKLQRTRDALVERDAMMAAIATAVFELRNGMLQVAAEYARRADLPREKRLVLQGMIERGLDEFTAKLPSPRLGADLADVTKRQFVSSQPGQE